jgi:N-acetylglucosaminyl-diphospho-decaprenol L-rhamnosyltransferase
MLRRPFDMTSISCVVVTYNSSLELPSCLSALRAIAGMEIVVVDNASTDDSCEIARQYGARVVVSGSNLGFAAGANLGIAATSDATDVLLVNPDCQVSEACVASLVDRLREDPSLGIVVPVMELPSGSIGISGGSRPSLLKEWAAALRLDRMIPATIARGLVRTLRGALPSGFGHYLGTIRDGRVHRVAWASGFCMLIRRDVLTAIGGFNERFFLYFEDVDLCERAARAGWSSGIDAGVTARHVESSAAKRVGKSKLYFDGLVSYFSNRGLLARVSSRALRRLAS